jgi:hypothetical protein
MGLKTGGREAFAPLMQFERWASKKQGGSTSNGRDSAGRRLGVKKFAGEVPFSFKFCMNV